jgi:hypothetical protein
MESDVAFDVCGIARGRTWNLTAENHDIRCLVSSAEWKGWLRGLDPAERDQRSRRAGL